MKVVTRRIFSRRKKTNVAVDKQAALIIKSRYSTTQTLFNKLWNWRPRSIARGRPFYRCSCLRGSQFVRFDALTADWWSDATVLAVSRVIADEPGGCPLQSEGTALKSDEGSSSVSQLWGSQTSTRNLTFLTLKCVHFCWFWWPAEAPFISRSITNLYRIG